MIWMVKTKKSWCLMSSFLLANIPYNMQSNHLHSIHNWLFSLLHWCRLPVAPCRRKASSWFYGSYPLHSFGFNGTVCVEWVRRLGRRLECGGDWTKNWDAETAGAQQVLLGVFSTCSQFWNTRWMEYSWWILTVERSFWIEKGEGMRCES